MLLVSALEQLTGWPLRKLFAPPAASAEPGAPRTNPAEMAGVMLMMIVMFGSFAAFAIIFTRLAERTRDAAQARRRVFRSLAAILWALLYLADPLMGLFAGVLGLIGLFVVHDNHSRHIGPFVIMKAGAGEAPVSCSLLYLQAHLLVRRHRQSSMWQLRSGLRPRRRWSVRSLAPTAGRRR